MHETLGEDIRLAAAEEALEAVAQRLDEGGLYLARIEVGCRISRLLMQSVGFSRRPAGNWNFLEAGTEKPDTTLQAICDRFRPSEASKPTPR
jgi:hypothetical protein